MEIDVELAKSQLSELLDQAAIGEEVVVTVCGRPVAKLVAVAELAPSPLDQPKVRTFGSARGEFTVPEDFDDPL